VNLHSSVNPNKSQTNGAWLATALPQPGYFSQPFASIFENKPVIRVSADKKILIVNDMPDQLELMRKLLRQSGYMVSTALSGREGVEATLAEHPDLIISDVSMPEINGIEMCRLIRQHFATSAIPILLVSAIRKDSESVMEGLKAGADDFLEAPYDPLRLITKVAQLIERSEIEQRLNEAEKRFCQLADNINEVFWLVDADACRMLFVSRAYQVIWGRSCESLYQQPESYLEAVHPEDRGQTRDAVARQKRGESTEAEYRIIRPDGAIRWIHDRAFPIRDERGKVSRIVGIAEDVTDHKRAEEALRRSEQAYHLLFDSNPQPMWVFDLVTLGFLEVNEAAIRHYGYSREEFLSMTIKDIRPPGDVPALLEYMSGGVNQFEEAGVRRHQKKDGTIISVEIASYSLTLYDRPARIVLAHDVTERRSLEEQLRQSQKLEAIGQLAGGIAHDFNNLLTAINGYSDLTIEGLETEDPLRRNIEQVRKAGERAASLTRQLLAFSRKQVMQPKVLDINSLVVDLGKMLRRLVGEHIEFMTLLRPEAGRINADPGQIEQVILNLVLNARDAMPRGGKLIIETANIYLDEQYAQRHVAVKRGQYVMLTVSDTGIGMDPATQASMFEPFFTTKEIGKGTGLGLSTVYGIVKQSGGDIWAYSEVDKGTTFRVYLPRVTSDAQPYKRTTETESPARGTETVLVVEDDEKVRRLVREVLRKHGYEVLDAANGNAALSVAESHSGAIHLLVTDVVMPQLSGREVADRLAALRPEMKVLFMSGYTDDAVVHHGILDANTPFIQKPFATGALARKVRDVLDGRA
jgi:PAS domain S-box-containing protein